MNGTNIIRLRAVKLALLLLGLLAGCSFFELRPDDTMLARVHGSRLYLDDISPLIPKGASSQDSAAFVHRYVDRWVQQQVFLYQAQQNMSVNRAEIDQRVSEYRNTLIMHAYESELAIGEMDTVVTDSEIVSYYEENEQHFILKDNIVRVNYIKLPLNVADHSFVRGLYRSENEDDLTRLENYCLENAATYYVGVDRWLIFGDIAMDMPLEIEAEPAYLRNNRYAEITDEYYRYFLYIGEYRLKGDISPLDFERENLRMLILNRRKRQFLENKRREFFNQAVEANNVETYY